jgi:hypothetical protein
MRFNPELQDMTFSFFSNNKGELGWHRVPPSMSKKMQREVFEEAWKEKLKKKKCKKKSCLKDRCQAPLC